MSKLQEKYPLIMNLLRVRDADYFGCLPTVPCPDGDLMNAVVDLFHKSLPAWNQCKDIFLDELAEAEEAKEKKSKKGRKRRRIEEDDSNKERESRSRDVKVKKARHNFPHDFMILKYLDHLQKTDDRFKTAYSVHSHTFKMVSRKVYTKHQAIWSEMCKLMFS